MKETVTLKLDAKAVRSSNILNWTIIPIVFLGACSLLYKSFRATDSEIESIIAKLLGFGVFLLILWIIKLLWSQSNEHNRQLRDEEILYELTPKGITNHYGTTQKWSDFKKIYFYKGSVHFSYKSKPTNAFVMSNTGMNAEEFREACRFIKAHSPENATKNFNP